LDGQGRVTGRIRPIIEALGLNRRVFLDLLGRVGASPFESDVDLDAEAARS
jgi:hypothetical protein